MGLFDWFINFNVADLVPQSITSAFIKVGNFIDSVILFGLNVYVVFIILVFFALVVGLVWVPVKLYPLYKQNKQIIDKVIKLQ